MDVILEPLYNLESWQGKQEMQKAVDPFMCVLTQACSAHEPIYIFAAQTNCGFSTSVYWQQWLQNASGVPIKACQKGIVKCTVCL